LRIEESREQGLKILEKKFKIPKTPESGRPKKFNKIINNKSAKQILSDFFFMRRGKIAWQSLIAFTY